MSHKQESIDFSSNATLPIDVHSLQSSSTGNLSTLGRDYNVTLNGSEYSASGPENSVGTCILFFILASCFCLCAKSNVPDERYRLYPNGVPPVKKKRKIDPEKRKKLIERSVITKEVTGQKEPGVMILSEFRSDDDHDDGTRTLVQKFSDHESQLFQSEEGNEEEELQDEENNPVGNIASNTGLDIDDDEDDITCMICLEPFEIGDKVTWSKQMKCRHIFHHECIHPWLLKNEECPCCRLLYIPRTKYDEDRTSEDNENSSDQNESEADEDEWNEEEDDPSSAYFIINGLISRVGEQFRSSIVNSVNMIRSSSFSSSTSQDDQDLSKEPEPNQSYDEQNLSPCNSDDSMLDEDDDIEKTYSLQELRDADKCSNRLRFWKMSSNSKKKIVRRLESCNYNSIRNSLEGTQHNTCAVSVSEVEMGIVSENSSTALNQIFRISPRNSFSSNKNQTSSNTSKNI